jgi:type VI protein secretion system component VasK
MRRSNGPAYWQFDLFLMLMIALMAVALQAQFPPSWYRIIEIAWSALFILGMGLWIRVNWAALREEERKQREASRTQTTEPASEPERTLPLARVQKRFLKGRGGK